MSVTSSVTWPDKAETLLDVLTGFFLVVFLFPVLHPVPNATYLGEGPGETVVRAGFWGPL